MLNLAGKVIAFEGVDGAGKSTVISLVAKRLRAAGRSVFLPRVGKEPSSRPARMIRALTRDRCNLDLDARAELALYIAREVQVLAEQVRPAVAAGATVLLDRSLLTPVVLGAFGRGLPLADCVQASEGASGGFEPDITMIFDVHPRTSRIRSRLAKAQTSGPRDPSRKGLAGSELKTRVWAGYKTIANERGYPHFHAERIAPALLADRVVEVLRTGATPAQLESPLDAVPQWQLDPSLDFDAALASVPEVVALYMTRGLAVGRDRRQAALERLPALVAWAMDRTDPLRESLLATHPEAVLSSWPREPLGPHDPRLAHVGSHPELVARCLRNLVSAEADDLRISLSQRAPGEVLESLSRREDVFASELRSRLWSRGTSAQRATSLVGCSMDDAWKLRDELFEEDPAIALRSLKAVPGERAYALRSRYAAKAPKAVLGSLAADGTTEAHALRRRLQGTGREVVDSLGRLADDASLGLREEAAERWPSTVIGSLAAVPESTRASAIERRCREVGGGDLHILRHDAAKVERIDAYDNDHEDSLIGA